MCRANFARALHISAAAAAAAVAVAAVATVAAAVAVAGLRGAALRQPRWMQSSQRSARRLLAPHLLPLPPALPGQ
eukprot:341444-Chlamydomonas_euryale.AAC.1